VRTVLSLSASVAWRAVNRRPPRSVDLWLRPRTHTRRLEKSSCSRRDVALSDVLRRASAHRLTWRRESGSFEAAIYRPTRTRGHLNVSTAKRRMRAASVALDALRFRALSSREPCRCAAGIVPSKRTVSRARCRHQHPDIVRHGRRTEIAGRYYQGRSNAFGLRRQSPERRTHRLAIRVGVYRSYSSCRRTQYGPRPASSRPFGARSR
jgi:hypothetical protein